MFRKLLWLWREGGKTKILKTCNHWSISIQVQNSDSYCLHDPGIQTEKSISASFVVFTSCCCLAAALCPTVCSPVDCSPPGSSVHGIFQARILEWVAIPFSRGSFPLRDQTCVSCISKQNHQGSLPVTDKKYNLKITCSSLCSGSVSCFNSAWTEQTQGCPSLQPPTTSGAFRISHSAVHDHQDQPPPFLGA